MLSRTLAAAKTSRSELDSEAAHMAHLRARIAFLAPLTGPEAIVGVPLMQAASLAIEEANKRPGLPCSLELLPLDDKASPTTARALAETIAADREIIGLVGHKNSGPSSAAGSIYAAAELAQITPSSTNSALAHQGWSTFFRICADNDRQAAAAAKYALDNLQVRRVAIVHDGTEYGRPLAEAFISEIVRGKGQVVLVESVQQGQRDFGETVERLAAASCDLVYFGLTEIESSSLTRELRASGLRAYLFGADGGRQSPFPQLAGESAEGVYETYAGVDPQTSPAGRAFLRAYEGRYGRCPIFGPEAYDAAGILAAALRQSQRPERAAILEKVRNTEGFRGATGPITFQANGNRRNAQVTIWRVVKGEMTLLS